MSGLDLAKNNLQLGECKKFFERLEFSATELANILREKFSDGIFVAWRIQDVIWGKFDGENFSLPNNQQPNFDDWLECRFFNAQEELHLKRSGKIFVGRYVRDDAGTGDFYVDSFAQLWGKRDKNFSADGWVKLLDASRKISMVIPCAGDKKTYGLTTRNYIGSDDATGLSGYVDYRFVALDSAWDGD